MSETTMRYCDKCAAHIGDTHYDLTKYDRFGWVGNFDLCSPGCLAAMAVDDAEDIGAAQNHEAVQSKLSGAPKRVRKWWQR